MVGQLTLERAMLPITSLALATRESIARCDGCALFDRRERLWPKKLRQANLDCDQVFMRRGQNGSGPSSAT